MQDIKLVKKTSFFQRLLAVQLLLTLSCSGITPAYAATPVGDVSVDSNSAAVQNIGRAMQSPEAKSSKLPNRNALQSQPNIILP
ncbi:MAG: hypothetical protein RLZZ406_1038, partial [Pseudomonadota bacterium]